MKSQFALLFLASAIVIAMFGATSAEEAEECEACKAPFKSQIGFASPGRPKAKSAVYHQYAPSACNGNKYHWRLVTDIYDPTSKVPRKQKPKNFGEKKMVKPKKADSDVPEDCPACIARAKAKAGKQGYGEEE